MSDVITLSPYAPSSSLFALAADAVVTGRHRDAALLTREADRALQWELRMSLSAGERLREMRRVMRGVGRMGR